MGFALIWILGLAASVLLVAAVVASGTAARSRRRRAAFGIIVAAVLAAPPALFGSVAWRLNAYFLSWAIALAVLAATVIVLGLWRRNGIARAAAWPKDKLWLAFLAVFVLHIITFWNMDLAVKQQLNQIRNEAGAIVAMAAPTRVPDRDNAALFYKRAFAVLPRDIEGIKMETSEYTLYYSAAVFNLSDPKFRAYLKSAQPCLNLLRKGTAKPDCYFDHDYARLLRGYWDWPSSSFRYSARLLGMAARCEAADGDTAAALRDIAAIYRMADHAGRDHNLGPASTVPDISNIAADALHSILPEIIKKSKDPPDLVIADFDFQLIERRALRVGEASELALFCDRAESGPYAFHGEFETGLAVQDEWLLDAALPIYRVFLIENEIVEYRQAYQKCLELYNKPYPEALAGWKEYEKNLRPWRDVAPWLRPAVYNSPDWVGSARTDALHGLARTALAAASFKVKNKHFPAKLDDLVPEFLDAVPLDPFDGKPLKLVQTPEQFTIYSVGHDGKDDGGASKYFYDRSQERRPDITFPIKVE